MGSEMCIRDSDCKINGLLELRRELKIVRRREHVCIIFPHNDFPNVELHAVQRWVKVTTPAASLFVTGELTTEGEPDEVEGSLQMILQCLVIRSIICINREFLQTVFS